jgi:hypothetical protein
MNAGNTADVVAGLDYVIGKNTCHQKCDICSIRNSGLIGVSFISKKYPSFHVYSILYNVPFLGSYFRMKAKNPRTAQAPQQHLSALVHMSFSGRSSNVLRIIIDAVSKGKIHACVHVCI